MKECDNQSMMFQDVSFFLRDEKAREQGLQDLVQHHSVVVNGGQFKKLQNSSIDENVVKLALQLSVNDTGKASLLIRSDILNPLKTFVYLRPSSGPISE